LKDAQASGGSIRASRWCSTFLASHANAEPISRYGASTKAGDKDRQFRSAAHCRSRVFNRVDFILPATS